MADSELEQLCDVTTNPHLAKLLRQSSFDITATTRQPITHPVEHTPIGYAFLLPHTKDVRALLLYPKMGTGVTEHPGSIIEQYVTLLGPVVEGDHGVVKHKFVDASKVSDYKTRDLVINEPLLVLGRGVEGRRFGFHNMYEVPALLLVERAYKA